MIVNHFKIMIYIFIEIQKIVIDKKDIAIFRNVIVFIGIGYIIIL
ncbi:hypothetical protein Y001_10735 [Staphylococcus aureus MUF256]|nr:hypothetical protein Y001_10735 [Staphylococcus aureus MUF256]